MALSKAKQRDEQAKKIKDSMLRALKIKGKPAAFVLDRIDEYMKLWGIRQQLFDAVGKTKAIITYDNGGGQKGTKINDAIKALPPVSKRMSDILESLELDGVVEDDESSGL